MGPSRALQFSISEEERRQSRIGNVIGEVFDLWGQDSRTTGARTVLHWSQNSVSAGNPPNGAQIWSLVCTTVPTCIPFSQQQLIRSSPSNLAAPISRKSEPKEDCEENVGKKEKKLLFLYQYDSKIDEHFKNMRYRIIEWSVTKSWLLCEKQLEV